MPKTYGQRWQTVSDIGEGGQGIAYLVKDLRGDGGLTYVLKRLKNPSRLQRLKAEVEAARSLSHPNIMRLVDFDLESSPPYIVSEYCAGGSLEDSDPFWLSTPEAVLGLFAKIAEAVAYAHRSRIIHRDIKPANILLRNPGGEPVVADFGLCFFLDSPERFTATGEAVGSRLFIAPELEDGRLEQITAKCDVYSLGKLLYWLFAGKTVFAREKHREPAFELRELTKQWFLGYGFSNSYMEYVDRLLDKMIVTNPEERIAADHVVFLVRDTIRLLNGRYNPLGKGIPQLCTYCGQGQYHLQPVESDTIVKLGLNAVDPHSWRILICESCGHVQLFRPNKAKNNAWWST